MKSWLGYFDVEVDILMVDVLLVDVLMVVEDVVERSSTVR